MNYFWIYNLPLFWSFLLIVGSITAFSIGGIFVLKPYVSKWWKGHNNNDQIAFYLSAVGVFYGITLGLLAAGVWQNFEDAEEKVLTEAAAINALYRDVTAFPEPKKDTLQKKISLYLFFIIHKAWPQHRQGITNTGGTSMMSDLHHELFTFEPKTKREEIIFAEALRQFNKVSEARRLRLGSVTQGLPSLVWVMILIGAATTLIICWLFHMKHLRMHIILNGLIGITIGTLIFLIMILDYPFKGTISISSEPYQEVYEQLVKK
jgi:hypothetical protein